jgi:hypothetical protein
VNGVYIQIVRQPGHLEATIDRTTKQRAFTNADNQRLTDLMLAQFRQKDYDAALLEGLRFIRDRMATNLGRSAGGTGSIDSTSPLPGPRSPGEPPPARAPGPQAPRSSPIPSTGACGMGIGTWFCLGAAVLIVVMMVRAARRLRSGLGPGPTGGAPPYGGGYGGGFGGGGGGFGRGILGGLLGGMLGSWIGGRAWGQQPGQDDSTAGGGGPEAGGGFFDDSSGPSSAGGDFGDSSGDDFGGGSDFGGDAGGGDFGGSSSSGGDF